MMALIKCAECDNEVSSLAVACPKCGAPVATRNTAIVRPGKNPGIAAVLSLVIPGAGQIYIGEIGRGLGFLASVVVLIAFWNAFSNYSAFSSAMAFFAFIFALGAVAVAIWAITDAYRRAAEENVGSRDSTITSSYSTVPTSRLSTSQGDRSFSRPTPIEEPRDQCRICGERFARSQMMAHVRIHATEASGPTISSDATTTPKPTQRCHICSELVVQSKLTAHLRTHQT